LIPYSFLDNEEILFLTKGAKKGKIGFGLPKTMTNWHSKARKSQ
jgi:hypothetical protein